MHADSLRHSLLRINTYRALASPAWISLTSPDPTLSAFKLSWELEHLALRENEFKDSYMQLSGQCKKYACQLLEQCRSSEEVIAVLNKVSGVPGKVRCSVRSLHYSAEVRCRIRSLRYSAGSVRSPRCSARSGSQ